MNVDDDDFERMLRTDAYHKHHINARLIFCPNNVVVRRSRAICDVNQFSFIDSVLTLNSPKIT